MTVGGQRSCCSQWDLSDPQILPAAEANPDPLGDLAGLPVDYTCGNPLQFTGILLWQEKTRSLQRGMSKGGQIFTASWGEEEKGSSHRAVVPASRRQCPTLSVSGQGGCLLQEPKAISPRRRSQACICKGMTGTPKDPGQLLPGMAEKVEKRGRGFLCPGTPSSGSSQSSEKSLREGCLFWVTGESLQPCLSAEQTACNQSMLG